MTAIKTDTKYNFTSAENDIFSWSYFDGTSGKHLTHKASGRQIYHMSWLNEQGKMTEDVTGEIKNQAIEFWSELHKLQNAEPEPVELVEEKHSAGWCDKCHSYCYGDCQA
jgi:hypothetical protein